MLFITSRYSDSDIAPSVFFFFFFFVFFLFFFSSFIVSGVRNLNNGPCFVKSVNNRSAVCQQNDDCSHGPPSVGCTYQKILKEDADFHNILEF